MPKLAVEVKHYLRLTEATGLMQAHFFKKMQQRLGDNMTGLCAEWNTNLCVFHVQAMGKPLQGTVLVGELAVKFRGEMPQEAGIFIGSLEKAFREETISLLSN